MVNPVQQLLPLEEEGMENLLPQEVEEKVTLSMAALFLAVLIAEERRENQDVTSGSGS